MPVSIVTAANCACELRDTPSRIIEVPGNRGPDNRGSTVHHSVFSTFFTAITTTPLSVNNATTQVPMDTTQFPVNTTTTIIIAVIIVIIVLTAVGILVTRYSRSNFGVY